MFILQATTRPATRARFQIQLRPCAHKELHLPIMSNQPQTGVRQEEMPFAIVQGSPLLKLPDDLYIPPDALEVLLEAIEGTLDLLLYLIRRQNIDILDIPVAEITRQ